MTESEVEPESAVQSSPITEKVMHTTQKLGELFTQVGDKAKNLWGQIKEKQAQNETRKRTEQSQKEEMELSEEEFVTKNEGDAASFPSQEEVDQESAGHEDQDSFFADQIPTPDSVEELAKRTGWSDETIKDFFAGLDLDMKEAEDDEDPNQK